MELNISVGILENTPSGTREMAALGERSDYQSMHFVRRQRT